MVIFPELIYGLIATQEAENGSSQYFKKTNYCHCISCHAIAGTGWYFSNKHPVIVRTLTLQPGTLHAELLTVGTITSRHEVEISATTQGIITKIYIEKNQSVKKNDILLRLDDREANAEFEKIKAMLIRYQAEKEQAERSFDSLVQILNVGGEAKQTVDNAKSHLQITKARVRETEKELELTKLRLEKMTIRSPFAGMITTRTAEVGQRVAQGSQLFTLTDVGTREIEVDVDASDIADVAVGQDVLVSSDSAPDHTWPANVLELGSAVFRDKKANTNYITVRIGFKADPESLRVGEQIDARIRTASRTNTLILPFSAIIQRKNKTFVATIQDDRISYVRVKPGLENLTHIEILGGLKAGDEIAW